MTDSCFNEAIARLNDCLREARDFGETEPNCCFMATTGNNGQPSVRIITIYTISGEGLSFIAHRLSGKAIQLLQNPKAGLCFYWPAIKLQVTIEGTVEELNRQQGESLWLRRDYNANIAAWAADMAAGSGQQPEYKAGDVRHQEHVDGENHKDNNSSKDANNYKKAAIKRFQGARPPMPASWSGFRLLPDRIEFWQTEWRKNKKHQCYLKKAGLWHQSSY